MQHADKENRKVLRSLSRPYRTKTTYIKDTAELINKIKATRCRPTKRIINYSLPDKHEPQHGIQ